MIKAMIRTEYGNYLLDRAACGGGVKICLFTVTTRSYTLFVERTMTIREVKEMVRELFYECLSQPDGEIHLYTGSQNCPLSELQDSWCVEECFNIEKDEVTNYTFMNITSPQPLSSRAPTAPSYLKRSAKRASGLETCRR